MATSPKKNSKFIRAIPRLLKARRKELGLTLQQLAKISGLSTAFISQAERGVSTPSAMSLTHLSEALNVDRNYFLSSPPTNSLIHRANTPRLLKIDSPLTYRRIDSDIAHKKINAFVIELQAQHATPVSIDTEGEELIYVVQGEIVLNLNNESFVLTEGDSSHFNAHIEYRITNLSNKPAKVLWNKISE